MTAFDAVQCFRIFYSRRTPNFTVAAHDRETKAPQDRGRCHYRCELKRPFRPFPLLASIDLAPRELTSCGQATARVIVRIRQPVLA
jgi:hypothetical protein